mgnify:CR=1 FL=1
MGVFEWLRLVAGSVFLLIGLVIFFTEIFGVFHFRYVLNRMHATAMGDTLGISSCMIGLMIFSGWNYTTLKLLLIVVFLWLASPVSSHVLARLEVATNDNLEALHRLSGIENFRKRTGCCKIGRICHTAESICR